MLKAKVVLPDGVVIDSEQGVPQGSPLSPLLSNIVLDELDQELARRGHRFVRYADDANVYVRSERAGQRVMASLTEFIEGRLRLKVNQAKSAVARPEDRHFLGFRLRLDPQTGTVEVLLSERTKRNAMERIRQLTPRNWGSTLASCIPRINAWLRGWHGFFGIACAVRGSTCCARSTPISGVGCARSCCATGNANARSRGASSSWASSPQSVWRQIYSGRKSWWALSHTPRVDQGLPTRTSPERVADLPWSSCTGTRTGRSSPPTRHNWRYGDDFEVDKPAGGGVHNPPSRRAVYDQRTYGSVGAGAGNRPGYPRAIAAGARRGGGSGACLRLGVRGRGGSARTRCRCR